MNREHNDLPILGQFTGATDDLRDALRSALAEVMDESLLSSRVIAARLGVDKSLGWSCLRISTVQDVRSTLVALPGRRAWRKVLTALAAAGCDEQRLETLSAAADAVHTQLDEASLDREALRALATEGGREEDDHTRHLQLRKRFYETSRLMWGVSARGIVTTHVLLPSTDRPGMIDLAALQIVHGLERHRSGPPWTFYYSYIVHDGTGSGMRAAEGLGGPDTHGGLVEDLSSPGLLDGEVRMVTAGRRVPVEDLWVYEFAAPAPGRRGPIRAVFGEIVRSIGQRQAETPGDSATLSYAATVPTPLLVFDALVHPSLSDLGPPEVSLAATFDNNAAVTYRLRFDDQLKLPIGGSVSDHDTLDLPRPLTTCTRTYRNLISRATDALGGDGSDLLLHRTCVPHPPLTSTLEMSLPLPT